MGKTMGKTLTLPPIQSPVSWGQNVLLLHLRQRIGMLSRMISVDLGSIPLFFHAVPPFLNFHQS